MKLFAYFWIALTVALVTLAWLWALYGASWMGSSWDECIKLYQSNARTPLFSGFITMGSFLLALKTNILSRLKENYDSPEYRMNYRATREQPGNSHAKYYDTLEKLSKALGWNIYYCLITAMSQMTLGFVFMPWAFGVCAGLAAGCLLFLVTLTYYLLSAHNEWFDTIEKQMQATLKQLDSENETK